VIAMRRGCAESLGERWPADGDHSALGPARRRDLLDGTAAIAAAYKSYAGSVALPSHRATGAGSVSPKSLIAADCVSTVSSSAPASRHSRDADTGARPLSRLARTHRQHDDGGARHSDNACARRGHDGRQRRARGGAALGHLEAGRVESLARRTFQFSWPAPTSR
jgi:hypothetical protein